MSGSGRPRTSSFAEPPGAPGAAAAAAGSAVAGGGSSGKSGAAQASGATSTGFGNLKLSSKYRFTELREYALLGRVYTSAIIGQLINIALIPQVFAVSLNQR